MFLDAKSLLTVLSNDQSVLLLGSWRPLGESSDCREYLHCWRSLLALKKNGLSLSVKALLHNSSFPWSHQIPHQRSMSSTGEPTPSRRPQGSLSTMVGESPPPIVPWSHDKRAPEKFVNAQLTEGAFQQSKFHLAWHWWRPSGYQTRQSPTLSQVQWPGSGFRPQPPHFLFVFCLPSSIETSK